MPHVLEQFPSILSKTTVAYHEINSVA